jgi:hypothetical protein
MIGEPTSEDKKVAALPSQRLCNEIQLFDLCDLERCSFKVGRYCTNAELLSAFEQISDAEVTPPEVFVEDGEDAGDGEYDDAFEDDEFGDEAEYDE